MHTVTSVETFVLSVFVRRFNDNFCVHPFIASAICHVCSTREFLNVITIHSSFLPLPLLLPPLISGVSLKYSLGNDPHIALASSVLLLVPGFPLIEFTCGYFKRVCKYGNGTLDHRYGSHFCVCLGIVFALNLLNIVSWVG